MWEGSSTEGDNIHKQVGLGWMRELPEHGTLTKQESKPVENVCSCIYLNFVASVSTLNSQHFELYSEKKCKTTIYYLRCFCLVDSIKQQCKKLEQQKQPQKHYKHVILLLNRIYMLFWRNVEIIRNWDGKSHRKLFMDLNRLFSYYLQDWSANSMQPEELEIRALQPKIDTENFIEWSFVWYFGQFFSPWFKPWYIEWGQI